MKVANNSDLINGLKRGNEDAYAYLVDYYNHSLCVYANSLINDRVVAQDIVQNVFLKTWEKRNRLQPELSLKSYLYKSVYNEFVDQYRKNQAVTAIEAKYIRGLEIIIEDKDQEALEKLIVLVKKSIQELPPRCKEIFILSKKEGLSNFEIAEHLNLSKKTIESQISKAFKLLRERLGNKYETVFFLAFTPGTTFSADS